MRLFRPEQNPLEFVSDIERDSVEAGQLCRRRQCAHHIVYIDKVARLRPAVIEGLAGQRLSEGLSGQWVQAACYLLHGWAGPGSKRWGFGAQQGVMHYGRSVLRSDRMSYGGKLGLLMAFLHFLTPTFTIAGSLWLTLVTILGQRAPTGECPRTLERRVPAANHEHLSSVAPEGRVELVYHGLDAQRFPSLSLKRPARDGSRRRFPDWRAGGDSRSYR